MFWEREIRLKASFQGRELHYFRKWSHTERCVRARGKILPAHGTQRGKMFRQMSHSLKNKFCGEWAGIYLWKKNQGKEWKIIISTQLKQYTLDMGCLLSTFPNAALTLRFRLSNKKMISSFLHFVFYFTSIRPAVFFRFFQLGCCRQKYRICLPLVQKCKGNDWCFTNGIPLPSLIPLFCGGRNSILADTAI